MLLFLDKNKLIDRSEHFKQCHFMLFCKFIERKSYRKCCQTLSWYSNRFGSCGRYQKLESTCGTEGWYCRHHGVVGTWNGHQLGSEFRWRQHALHLELAGKLDLNDNFEVNLMWLHAHFSYTSNYNYDFSGEVSLVWPHVDLKSMW